MLPFSKIWASFSKSRVMKNKMMALKLKLTIFIVDSSVLHNSLKEFLLLSECEKIQPFLVLKSIYTYNLLVFEINTIFQIVLIFI